MPDVPSPRLKLTLDEFVLLRWRSLVTMAYLLSGDWPRAEDLVQTALLRCLNRWGRIENPEAYVRKAVLNVYLSQLRRRTNEFLTDEPPEAATEPVAPPFDFFQELKNLPARQRAVIVLRYYEDRSVAETADLLGVSIGTVKSQQSRAIARLRSDREAAAEIAAHHRRTGI